MRRKFYFAVVFLLLSVPLAAQAPPSGVGVAGPTYWIGGAFSFFNPDYGCGGDGPFHCWDQQLIGVVPYVDTSSFIWHRIGVEGEARLMIFHSPFDQVQTSYLGGPRVRIFRRGNFLFTGKFLIGYAHLDVKPGLGDGSYFAYAPGGAIDYRITRYVAVRLDYEHQRWPEFPCWHSCASGANGGLTPNGFSFGVSYALHSAGTEVNPN